MVAADKQAPLSTANMSSSQYNGSSTTKSGKGKAASKPASKGGVSKGTLASPGRDNIQRLLIAVEDDPRALSSQRNSAMDKDWSDAERMEVLHCVVTELARRNRGLQRTARAAEHQMKDTAKEVGVLKAHIRSLEAERNELSAKLKGRKRDTPRDDSSVNEVYEEPIELEFQSLLHKIRKREVQRTPTSKDAATHVSYEEVSTTDHPDVASTKFAVRKTPRDAPCSSRSNVSVEEYQELEKHCMQLKTEKKEMLSEMALHATETAHLMEGQEKILMKTQEHFKILISEKEELEGLLMAERDRSAELTNKVNELSSRLRSIQGQAGDGAVEGTPVDDLVSAKVTGMAVETSSAQAKFRAEARARSTIEKKLDKAVNDRNRMSRELIEARASMQMQSEAATTALAAMESVIKRLSSQLEELDIKCANVEAEAAALRTLQQAAESDHEEELHEEEKKFTDTLIRQLSNRVLKMVDEVDKARIPVTLHLSTAARKLCAM